MKNFNKIEIGGEKFSLLLFLIVGIFIVLGVLSTKLFNFSRFHITDLLFLPGFILEDIIRLFYHPLGESILFVVPVFGTIIFWILLGIVIFFLIKNTKSYNFKKYLLITAISFASLAAGFLVYVSINQYSVGGMLLFQMIMFFLILIGGLIGLTYRIHIKNEK